MRDTRKIRSLIARQSDQVTLCKIQEQIAVAAVRLAAQATLIQLDLESACDKVAADAGIYPNISVKRARGGLS